MTISSATNKAQFSGNGVTTAFPFTFKTFASGDLEVYLTSALGVDSTLTLTTHYTVALAGDQDASPGGTLTMLTAPATGETLTILRVIDATQLTDITNGGGFYPQVVENALDKLTMLAQQNAEKLKRAVVAGVTETVTVEELLADLDAAVIAAEGSATSASGSASAASGSAAAAAASAAGVDFTASSTTTFSNKTLDSSCSVYHGVPVGTLIDFAGIAAPAGFLACPTASGGAQLKSRTTYAALYAALGGASSPWGQGDGSTTFGIPWFAADYAAVQANANVGTATTGDVKSHTHSLATTQAAFTVTTGGGAYGDSNSASVTGATGGSANLPAGVRVLKCVKY